jgi:hypothetical protein
MLIQVWVERLQEGLRTQIDCERFATFLSTADEYELKQLVKTLRKSAIR